LNGIPNDVSVVAGIITTEFQTTLSHINILSHNRHTPNMALKDGWTNPLLDTLLGELVFLKVESDSFYIRKANIDEATAFWNQREPQTPVVLQKDTETSGLIELGSQSISSVKTIGGKAANLAELVILDSIPLPEDYFAIPFYYYQQHIAVHGLDTLIQNMLADEAFRSNQEYRSSKLAQLRQLIIAAPLDPALTAAVLNRIQNFGNFDAYKFRSSTNAEDLESFSGAGLYDSFSAKKGSSSKTVDKAIKQVWASLWNLRAFDERDYYKIDENSVAMGVLVNRSFPNEDANGVVITRNLYNGNHGYIINVQYKEYSIVYPEPGIITDQIITYTINLNNQKYTIEYLTQSNLPELGGQTVLTDDEIYELADYCTRIKNHYYYDLPNNCNCGYESFAVDIEFKLDSEVENRKIYIKQARIYAAD
jgi:phosphoenolpyruvate synthase/pyruvate phosphate dikinase